MSSQFYSSAGSSVLGRNQLSFFVFVILYGMFWQSSLLSYQTLPATHCILPISIFEYILNIISLISWSHTR